MEEGDEFMIYALLMTAGILEFIFAVLLALEFFDMEAEKEAEYNEGYMDGYQDAKNRVIPLDVAPVIHSHWKEYQDYSGAVYSECARCGLVWWADEGTAEENEVYYCPKCGAKMDEVIYDGT